MLSISFLAFTFTAVTKFYVPSHLVLMTLRGTSVVFAGAPCNIFMLNAMQSPGYKNKRIDKNQKLFITVFINKQVCEDRDFADL